MKYTESNKPLVCMMTQSTCYKGTRKFTPKGVLWHSTGANNPTVKRYVQPDDDAPDRKALLEILGKNAYGNDWNHINRQAGMNFFIGQLADGSVAAVQTMPWDFRPWGVGSGSKGTANDTHIQFEICEDGLTSSSYFNAIYMEGVEMTAYLCRMYNIDPFGTIDYKGMKIPTIIDHVTSHELGIGGNHGDVRYWFKNFGATLDDVRNDVRDLLKEEGSIVIPPAPVKVDLPVLRFGSQDKATKGTVAYLQKKLGGLDIDGDFGNKTKAAVIAYQKSKGLNPDGVVGPLTWGQLER